MPYGTNIIGEAKLFLCHKNIQTYDPNTRSVGPGYENVLGVYKIQVRDIRPFRSR